MPVSGGDDGSATASGGYVVEGNRSLTEQLNPKDLTAGMSPLSPPFLHWDFDNWHPLSTEREVEGQWEVGI